jgi:hypothetical protein
MRLFGGGRLRTKSRCFFGLKKIVVSSPLLAFREATNRMVGGFLSLANRPFLKKSAICQGQ